jgi:hypothetical protein
MCLILCKKVWRSWQGKMIISFKRKKLYALLRKVEHGESLLAVGE